MDTPRVREEAGDALETIADQIEDGIAKGKFSLREIQNAMMEKTKAAAESTDKIVHDNPWSAVGVAAGLGFIVGLLIGYLAVQSGSLLPCVLYHMTHNSLMVASSMVQSTTLREYPLLSKLMREAPGGGYVCNLPTVLGATLVALVLLNWFRRLPYRKTPEEALEEAIQQHASHAPDGYGPDGGAETG